MDAGAAYRRREKRAMIRPVVGNVGVALLAVLFVACAGGGGGGGGTGGGPARAKGGGGGGGDGGTGGAPSGSKDEVTDSTGRLSLQVDTITLLTVDNPNTPDV